MVKDSEHIRRILREEINSFLKSSIIMEDVNPFDILKNDGINIRRYFEELQLRDVSKRSPSTQKAVYDISYFTVQVYKAIERCVSKGNINETVRDFIPKIRLSDYGINVPQNFNTHGAFFRGYHQAERFFDNFSKRSKGNGRSQGQSLNASNVQDARLETLLTRNFPVVERKYQTNKTELDTYVPEVFTIIDYIKRTLIPNYNTAKHHGT